MTGILKGGVFGWAVYLVLAAGFALVGSVAAGLGGEAREPSARPEHAPPPDPREATVSDLVDRALAEQDGRSKRADADAPRPAPAATARRSGGGGARVPARLHVYTLLFELGLVAIGASAAAAASPKAPLPAAGLTGGLVIATGIVFAWWAASRAPLWIGRAELPGGYLPLGTLLAIGVSLACGWRIREGLRTATPEGPAPDAAET
jgi:hypothetical protein